MPVDYFDLMFDRLQKEIQEIIESCKQVMNLPRVQKLSTHTQQDFDQAWKNQLQKLKQEMNNVLKDKDPVYQLAKLMSIKDNLLG